MKSDPQHLTLIVSGRARKPGYLDRQPLSPPAEPSMQAILAAWHQNTLPVASLTLSGGEPTLRSDLPALIAALKRAPSLGLHTDGQALTNPEVLGVLARAGLTRLRVAFHAGRQDAHDWLTGTPGGLKRATRAMQAALAAGLSVEAEVALTRPGTPLLPEAVELLARLGVPRVRVRRLVLRGPAAEAFASVSPRFGLAEPYLEAAAEVAREASVALSFHGFPACALGRARAGLAAPEPVLSPPALLGFFDDPPWGGACPACPGPPACPGAGADYVQRFGDSELRSEGAWVAAPVGAPPADPIAPPPPRAGRDPATRLRAVRRQVAREQLAGDPTAGVMPLAIPASLTMPFRAEESGRTLRLKLVRAAQEGAPLLLATGAGTLHHPELVALCRDAQKLRLRVRLAGEASGLSPTAAELRHLRQSVERVDIALFGPDAPRHDAQVGAGSFAAALALAETLAAARIPVGAYAVLRHHRDVTDYAAAWSAHAAAPLPGEPSFRLHHEGGDLSALAQVAGSLAASDGAVRDALAAVLPACLLPRPRAVRPAACAAPVWGDPTGGGPRGDDPLGLYTPCAVCEPAHCPGYAIGWSHPPKA